MFETPKLRETPPANLDLFYYQLNWQKAPDKDGFFYNTVKYRIYIYIYNTYISAVTEAKSR